MIETIKIELEIQVPRVKIITLRKLVLQGVHGSLKQQYSILRDFGREILMSNPQNNVKINITRFNKTDKFKFKRSYIYYYAQRPFVGNLLV